MKTKAFLISALLLLSSFLNAQDLNQSKLDSLFDAIERHNKGLGSVSILKNGQTVYARSIGFSSVNGTQKKPSSPDTRYRIGSVSKMFTATMVFQLIEEEKLDLTTPLSQFFPQIPNAESITLSHLLNHRSGIHNFTNDAVYVSYMLQPKSQADMLAIISQNKPDFTPNERTAYSNSNYVLLGYIIEKITGQTYADALKNRITTKVGLKNTYVGAKIDPDKSEAYSFNFLGDWVASTETDMSIPGGAGAIVSTSTDLTKFIDALFNQKLVSRESLAQMKTITDGLGMGMFQIPFYERKAFGHNGSIDSFLTTLSYFEEDQVAIAYCSNGQAMPMNDILIGILSIYFNKPYQIPDFKTVELKEEDLKAYLGVYSSPSFPLKITISHQGNKLFAQASGQAPFELEAIDKNKFKFSPAGINMFFDSEKKELTFTQGPGKYTLTKEQ